MLAWGWRANQREVERTRRIVDGWALYRRVTALEYVLVHIGWDLMSLVFHVYTCKVARNPSFLFPLFLVTAVSLVSQDHALEYFAVMSMYVTEFLRFCGLVFISPGYLAQLLYLHLLFPTRERPMYQ